MISCLLAIGPLLVTLIVVGAVVLILVVYFIFTVIACLVGAAAPTFGFHR